MWFKDYRKRLCLEKIAGLEGRVEVLQQLLASGRYSVQNSEDLIEYYSKLQKLRKRYQVLWG